MKAWKLDDSNLQVTFICVNTYVMENCECVCMHYLITLNDLTMFKGLVNTLSCVHLSDEGHNILSTVQFERSTVDYKRFFHFAIGNFTAFWLPSYLMCGCAHCQIIILIQ